MRISDNTIRRFDYMFADDPTTTMPDLMSRHGQPVTVVRELHSPSEYDFEDDRMYLIRFKDGYTQHAWGSELVEP